MLPHTGSWNERITILFLPMQYTVKKVSDFPVPSRDVTDQQSQARNNLIIPGQGEFGL